MKTVLMHFLKGILGGISASIGGFLYVLMRFLIPGEVGNFLGSLLFTTGQIIACSFALSLYPGKVGAVYEAKQDKLYYISLPVILLANAIGAFGMGYMCYFIFRNNASMMETVTSICTVRTTLNSFDAYLSCFVKAILCGLCVYLGVKSFNLNKLKPLGIFMLVFFVFTFVFCGFQNCISNMFYFGFGNHMNIYTLIDMVMVIVGNSIGPIIGVLLFKLFNLNKAA